MKRELIQHVRTHVPGVVAEGAIQCVGGVVSASKIGAGRIRDLIVRRLVALIRKPSKDGVLFIESMIDLGRKQRVVVWSRYRGNELDAWN